MKQVRKSLVQTFVAGVLLVVPVYLAILMLLKAMKSLGAVVRPVARLLPQSFPAETVISLLLVVMFCLLAGIILRTTFGQVMMTKIEDSILHKIPGYDVIRSMAGQLTGQGQDKEKQN